MTKSTNRPMLAAGASLAALITMLGASPALAQSSAVPAPNQVATDTNPEPDTAADVIVNGFRSSLARALDLKRTEAGAIDAILAEDIGKFPDLNLSESMQRIPGVALLRDGGEGRTISVRGLGPQFTRVRINGMEAIATAGGSDPSGGTNRGRGFDFNVFASDLFNAITVRKTADATTEEGSLGATVDLRTARPFDYNGFKIAASAQGSYNDLNKKATPRGAFMISDTFADGTLGALFSVAYTKRKLIEEGFSTVRWAPNFTTGPGAVTNFTPGFESVLGTTCVNTGVGGASGTSVTPAPAVCAAANAAFHPRFPRYDYFVDDQERIGATMSLQWKPSDNTLISIDGLYADFKATREERYLEANGFSVSGACTAASRPTNCGIADTDVLTETITNGVMTAGTFNDVDLRVENRFDRLDTKFKQITLDASQKFGDDFTVGVIAGHSSSNHTNPIQNTITFDLYNVDGFGYDFSAADGRNPVFNFGNAALTSTSAWVLSQIRLRSATAKNTYDTGQLNLKWNVTDGFELLAGAAYKKYGFTTTFLQRSNGTTSSQDTNVSCCNTAADPISNFSQIVNLGGTSVLIPDYFKAETYFNLTDPTVRGAAFKLGPEPGLGSNNSVQERDKSAYFQANFNRPLGEMTLRGNFGVRYVQTHQVANGYAFVGGAATPLSVARTYDDWLPAANVVLEVFPDFLVRAAAARVMARPDLGSLPPGVTVGVSGANRTVSSGNPLLDPYRANTYDFSVEWYYQPGALISAALFQKDIGSFVQTLTSTGTFSSNPFGLPDSLAIAACGTAYPATCNPASPNWTFTVPNNTPGGRLRGFEINVQQPFKFLPGFLSNTGVLLNYTHVTSKIGYLNGAGAVVATANLTGLSPDGMNGTLYYEDKLISTRVSASYRSDYLTRVPGQQGANVEGTNHTLNIDASLQVTVTDQIKLTLEGVNLTDQYQDQYVDSRNLLNVYHHTGREFLFGVRFNY
ncbi:TonB-dependent receptor [soil metagenome]